LQAAGTPGWYDPPAKVQVASTLARQPAPIDIVLAEARFTDEGFRTALCVDPADTSSRHNSRGRSRFRYGRSWHGMAAMGLSVPDRADMSLMRCKVPFGAVPKLLGKRATNMTLVKRIVGKLRLHMYGF